VCLDIRPTDDISLVHGQSTPFKEEGRLAGTPPAEYEVMAGSRN
jgi:hypothetical protein